MSLWKKRNQQNSASECWACSIFSITTNSAHHTAYHKMDITKLLYACELVHPRPKGWDLSELSELSVFNDLKSSSHPFKLTCRAKEFRRYATFERASKAFREWLQLVRSFIWICSFRTLSKRWLDTIGKRIKK